MVNQYLLEPIIFVYLLFMCIIYIVCAYVYTHLKCISINLIKNN